MKSSGSCWVVLSLLGAGALGAGCGVSFNELPVVEEGPVVSSRDVVSGQEVQMHLVVTDEEGDPLRYEWQQSPEAPAGSFSDTTVQEPSWVAPEVTEPRNFVLKVVIRDIENASVLSFTTVRVHPR